MGLKKYEIITVGSDKRVRALRSWRVGDRYVNIGDVGGIVYDEKTLSQDGACWLFRGNFGFPGARIGGDSIVDVGEATLSTTGTPVVDILGSSVVVGSKLRFASEQTAADAVVLKTEDFEVGTLNYAAGSDWETWKAASPNCLRTIAPIFNGGLATTVLKLDVPGYTVQAFVMDRDGKGVTDTAATDTGAGVTLSIPAGQYFVLTLAKTPLATIALSDVTTAAITFTGTYETKLSIIDSRVEVNPANSAGTTTIRPGGTYTIASGAKYPDSVIWGSKVVINSHATAGRLCCMMTELVNVNATIDATTADAQAVGIYHGVNNLVFTGLIASNVSETAHSLIQAYNCDNMVVNPTNFPGRTFIQATGLPPIRFYNCNLNNGRIYHHAQIANTYRDINFDLATADLDKAFSGNTRTLGSSEVNGMYRAIVNGTPGPLVESYESVKNVVFSQNRDMYGTTIYADAYFKGAFDIRGTNVFGNTMKHDASNTQDIGALLSQGTFHTFPVGSVITGVVSSANACAIQTPFRVTGSKGFTVQTPPTGLAVLVSFTDANNKVTSTTSWITVETPLSTIQLQAAYAYLTVKRVDNGPITPADAAGVTVTTYNSCRIVNTKATAAVIAGNVRIEDNATLIDVSVTGTGYFGGNAIIQAPSDLTGQLPIEGAAYMSDNAVFAPTEVNATAGISLIEMKDNAAFSGKLAGASTNYNITMADNAQFLGTHGSRNGFIMRGNSFVAASGTVAPECSGLLIMKDDARIESNSVTAVGYITLCGKYKQTASKTWTGKRVVDSQDAPLYDNNVKTQYDF